MAGWSVEFGIANLKSAAVPGSLAYGTVPDNPPACVMFPIV